MKVSVIIPVYGVALYIEECLKSVLLQTYPSMEIVLVNDCTKDESMDIVARVLREYSHSHSVKIVAHETNRGLSAARNTGLDYCSGEYVYFLDSDDELFPDAIQSLVDKMDGIRPDMVVGDYVVRGSDDFFPPLKLSTTLLRSRQESIRAYMKEKIYVMAWNKLVKKEFLLKNELYFEEGLIHEDCLWSFQCACLCDCVLIVKVPTYIYKVRTDSIKTGTKQEADVHALTEILKRMVACTSLYGLEGNGYVHSFLEEEKLRLLMTQQRYGWKREDFFSEYYAFLARFPRPSLFKLFFWSVFKTRHCIINAHYFLSVRSLQEDYYWNIPDLLWKRKWGKNRLLFYRWFLSTLFKTFLRTGHLTLPKMKG